eukprot:TRINITY_DN35768_c0_g1_i1.p1 TRINITY_DN35768_c0_g1~~TRINITY_DN35768_c0_g1_i1.p1  ORF type:complete len:131 (+),score=23.93 TRINITY_DN35768_c0_g1_i1:49-441(+)
MSPVTWCPCVSKSLCNAGGSCVQFHLEDVFDDKVPLGVVENMDEGLAERFKGFLERLIYESGAPELQECVWKLGQLCFRFPPSYSLEKCMSSAMTLMLDDLTYDLHKDLPFKRKATLRILLDFFFPIAMP